MIKNVVHVGVHLPISAVLRSRYGLFLVPHVVNGGGTFEVALVLVGPVHVPDPVVAVVVELAGVLAGLGAAHAAEPLHHGSVVVGLHGEAGLAGGGIAVPGTGDDVLVLFGSVDRVGALEVAGVLVVSGHVPGKVLALVVGLAEVLAGVGALHVGAVGDVRPGIFGLRDEAVLAS